MRLFLRIVRVVAVGFIRHPRQKPGVICRVMIIGAAVAVAAMVVFCDSSGWSQTSQSSTSEPIDFTGRSRTINQRIVVQWIDDSTFTFTEEFPDGSQSTKRVNAETGVVESIADDAGETPSGGLKLRGGPLPRSQPSAQESAIEFTNEAGVSVQIYWIETNGTLVPYGSVAPGETRSQHTFAGHAWMVKSSDGKFFGSAIALSQSAEVKIKETFADPKPSDSARQPSDSARPRRGFMDRLLGRNQSPDQNRSLQPSPGGLRMRIETADQPTWIDLDFGSTAGFEIASPTWSPDGSVVAAWKVKRNEPADAVTIESSPESGGRALVKRQPYRLPGDPYDLFELYLFDGNTGQRLQSELPVIDFGRPNVHWFAGHQLAIEKVDRGHQRVRLFVIDPVQGTTQTCVDDSTSTFVWTMHGPKIPLFKYLEKSDQVIYASETSGYRHLYLIDLPVASAQVDQAMDWRKNPITSGQWLVREIVRIDEDARTLDLLVGEFYDDQDPYHQHLVRVSLDGQLDGTSHGQHGVIAITAADGDHTVDFSPNGQYVIATHSRVDSPPVHELRRASDGEFVVELMRGSRLVRESQESKLPTVFHAPGRDGKTEIWGNLYFPADYDPELQAHYPVIEAIYAGPHDSHVPKRYLHSNRYEDLTSLGFVVVQIDGMGTANRSKAFHDQCWHNLKDAGFPDRIAWMKAAAQRYPGLDLSRVGIFGTSAGGQNACGALLFHGDFYKAAYAACGCHDNRMDKASWNEQWMGYPVGNHYAENSNIDNAHRLQGDLFLVVGELDSNVPPESTYRLVDALIKANKRFDFLMVPGMGHSDGGTYGKQRMREFFREKLTDKQGGE